MLRYNEYCAARFDNNNFISEYQIDCNGATYT